MKKAGFPSSRQTNANLSGKGPALCPQIFALCLLIWFFGLSSTPFCRAGTLSENGLGSSPRHVFGPDPKDLLHQAEVFFKKANGLINKDKRAARIYFTDALVFFEALRDRDGIENGKLLFNIGNCYFRIGDLGRAVLNYREAGQFLPEDPRILENLALARAAANAGPPASRPEAGEFFPARGGKATRSAVPARLISWCARNARTIRIWFFPIASALFWSCLGLVLIRPQGRVRLLPAASILVLLVSGLLLSLGAGHFHPQTDGVIVSQTTARKGNCAAFDPLPQKLPPGTEFKVIERRRGWYLMKIRSGESGWIPCGAAKLIGR